MPQRLVGVQQRLGVLVGPARPALDEVAGHGERRPGERQHRHVGPELGADEGDGLGDVGDVVGLAAGAGGRGRRGGAADRGRPGRCRGDVDAEPGGVGRHDDVAVEHGGVDAVAVHRLQRDRRRQLGLLDGVEDRALAAHGAVLREAATGLAHEPHRRVAARPARSRRPGTAMRSASTWRRRRYWPVPSTPPAPSAPIEFREPLFGARGRGDTQHPIPGADHRDPRRTNDAAAPRTGGRAGPRRPRVRVPRSHEAVGVAHARPHRGRPRRHVPGALRAQRVRRGPRQAARRPRPRRRRPRVRAHRPHGRDAGHDGGVPHRPPGRRRRAVRADRRRLAGTRRRAVLPGHRTRADGPRAPPPLRRRGAHRPRHRGRAVRRRPPRCRPRRRPRAGRAAPNGERRRCRRERRPSGAARLLHAARRPRARAHRHARRHRRHDPGRAGRDHPLAAGRRARRAGRSRHRQDRRRPPPRRLPAVHAPLPARGPGRPRHRAEPGVPALHRARPAVARRGRGRAGRARRPRARASTSPGPAIPATPTWRRGSRATPACPTSSTRPSSDRQRPLRDDLRVPFRTGYVRLAASETARIVKAARRRFRRHNGGRRFVEGEVFGALAASWRGDPVTAGDIRQALRHAPRRARRARAHLAGADPGPAAARPVRLARPAAPRRRRDPERRRDRRPAPATRRTTSPRCAGPRPTWRCSTTPATCSVRGSAGAARSTTATRSARTATSSSTRSRTSRRCSSRWPPAGR